MVPKSVTIRVGDIETNVLTRNGDTRVISRSFSSGLAAASFAASLFFDGALMYPNKSSSQYSIGSASVYAIFPSRRTGAAFHLGSVTSRFVRIQERTARADT